MEISPISGIRVMPVVKAPPAESNLSRVANIDNSANPGDDTYSGSGKKSAGGQDDENQDTEQIEKGPEAESAAPTSEAEPGPKINYFA